MKRLKELLDRISGRSRMEDINYVKKLYKRSQTELLVTALAALLIIYTNYNYFILKIKTMTESIFSDRLDEIAEEAVGEPASLRNFDMMTISLYSEKMQDKDKYFKLYKQGEFRTELEQMQEIGESSMLYKTKKGSGVIKFRLFTSSAVKKVKKELDTVKDCDDLIIDLRSNTGGMLDSAEQFAELFLDSGKTIYTYETKQKKKTVKSRKNAQLKPKRIVILQNEWTASASELFINALKENLDNVTVVGVRSYGKGIGQNEYFLTDGYAFKLTVMRLYTPKGNSINETGIIPDKVYSGREMLTYAEEKVLDK